MVKYTIPFAGMAFGNHQFEYKIDDQFFEAFENSVIKNANVLVKLDFLRSENVLTLTFTFKGTIRQTCDRCLDDFEFPVDSQKMMLVRFGEPGEGETDEIIVIHHGDHQLNIAQHIYDYLSLLIPMRVVHPNDESGKSLCNEEFLSRLDERLDESNQSSDPRWDALKNLGVRKN